MNIQNDLQVNMEKMSEDVLRELPDPPEVLSGKGVEVWHKTGIKLLKNESLKTSNINKFTEFCFWEDQKSKVKENLHGYFTSHQTEISSGNVGNIRASILLSNYKAIQDEINELRSFFGLNTELPEFISNTPEIPEEVYQNLPESFHECFNLIVNKQNRDTFLVMAIPVLSAHLTNVEIENADGYYKTNYFTFVANSKSGINRYAKKARDLMSVLNRKILQGSAEGLIHPFISLITGSKTIQKQLLQNSGNGLIFEEHITEAVSSSAFDFSIFSNIIENSYSQKYMNVSSENGGIFVLKPTVSGSFNGTLKDVKEIAEKTGEIHLTNYSFFLHESSEEWQSHRPTEFTKRLNEEIENLSEKLYEVFSILSARKKIIEVEFSENQWQSIDETFKEKMDLIDDLELTHNLRVANNKAAVHALKLASIFSVIRIFMDEGEDLSKLDILTPSDEDLTAALWLTDTFIKHAIRLYQNLPIMKKESYRGDRYNRFYGTLPVVFDTSEAVQIAKMLSIPVRTANRYLSELSDTNKLKKLRRGVYKKI